MTQGTLLIVCGPSGVGKSSLCTRLLAEQERLRLSVSYTTRAPRGQEVNGEHYHFVDVETFQAMIEEGAFAEHALVHGNYYGTSRAVVREALEAGADLLFDIDYQGARLLQEAFPVHSCAVMVMPPSMEVLEARLRGRGTDSADVISRRLVAAREEIAAYPTFHYALCNDDLSQAYARLCAIYTAQTYRISHQQPALDDLLAAAAST